MNKDLLKNTRISWKAKGLYCYLSTIKKSEKITIQKLVKVSKDGSDSVRSALVELVKADYLAIGNARNEKGQFDYCYYRLDK